MTDKHVGLKSSFYTIQKEKPAEQQKAKKEKGDAKKDALQVEKKEKKALSGGVFIEDLKVGSGPVAKPGKVVMVSQLLVNCKYRGHKQLNFYALVY